MAPGDACTYARTSLSEMSLQTEKRTIHAVSVSVMKRPGTSHSATVTDIARPCKGVPMRTDHARPVPYRLRRGQAMNVARHRAGPPGDSRGSRLVWPGRLEASSSSCAGRAARARRNRMSPDEPAVGRHHRHRGTLLPRAAARVHPLGAPVKGVAGIRANCSPEARWSCAIAGSAPVSASAPLSPVLEPPASR